MSNGHMSQPIPALLDRGVVMEQPSMVVVGGEVNPARIAPGVILHAGCRLYGEHLSIGPGCELGGETPMTVKNCQLEREVKLRGGYAEGAVFLRGSSAGSGAHIRPGTILEEEASVAHTVGLKQTVLLPFVTVGSLVNFCDILMAGGTSRKNHSEVGSSYIHFNFTPHQDKATGSLVGDVPRGVMLNQPPIFLGGQGGLVGPCRVAFGAIIPAGTVYRGDAGQAGHIHYAPSLPQGDVRPYTTGVYKDIQRLVEANLLYIGNLKAYRAWYRQIRKPFLTGNPYGRACYEGALKQIAAMLKERIKRLGEVIDQLPSSIAVLESGRMGDRSEEVLRQQRWMTQWSSVAERCASDRGDQEEHASFSRLAGALQTRTEDPYIQAIQALEEQVRAAGIQWLDELVSSETGLIQDRGVKA